MKKPIVYLVGSGPGDVNLLTIRACDLIKTCDVLIYDYLVDKSIISLASDSCEKIYVGKSGANHTLEQKDINRLIVEKALERRMTVRLKGGDPFIFGRGGEEALFCREKNINFEIVCGISSAYAVPAFAGIPVTHRGISSSVAFITGHEDPSKQESDIRWDRIASGAQTLVFLMGVKNLPYISSRLIENGLSANTPAAVIQNGCRPNQITITGTLFDIAEKVRSAKVSPPCIIIVGDVVSLRSNLNWFETKPLFGKRIIVTRSREQASNLVKNLTDLGADVIEFPSIKIIPVDRNSSIDFAIKKIDQYNWVIFTSVNGVRSFFNYIYNSGFDARIFKGTKIAAIGTATSSEMRSYGILPDLVPEKFTVEDLGKALHDTDEIKDRRFLLLRADIAPENFAVYLRENGALEVNDLTVYRTVPETPDLYERFSDDMLRKVDLVTFTSSSTVKNFAAILKDSGIKSFAGIKAAAIGPVTAKTALELGFDLKITSSTHTIDGLAENIVEYLFKDLT
jgi:uroporphyrinogen III methyltransferase/synthase